MADEAELTPTVAPSSAPQVAVASDASPSSGPVAASSPAVPEPVTTPEAPVQSKEPAPSDSSSPSETKPAEAAPADKAELPQPAPSLLAEEKPAEEAAPVDVKAEEVQIEVPAFESLALPEGIKLDEKAVGKFDAVLGKYETEYKLDHASVAALRQELADLYVADQSEAEQRRAAHQMQVWVDTRKEWRQQIEKHAEYGRNRFATNTTMVKQLLQRFGTPEFYDGIEVTGMGDHIGLFGTLFNIAQYMNRNGQLGEGKPVPANPPKMASKKSGPRGRYANSPSTGA